MAENAKRKGKKATAKRGKKSPAPIRPPEPENPWERQPDETDKAYAAFRVYLEMGEERSQQAVCDHLGKSRQLISRWSSRHRWVARVDAFAAAAHRTEDDAAMDEHAKRAKRQAQIAELYTEALALPGKELLERMRRDPTFIQRLDDDELIRAVGMAARALPRAVHVERLVSGVSTANIGNHAGGGFSDDAKRRADAQKRAGDMDDDRIDEFLLGALAGAEMERAKAQKEKKK